MESSAFLEKVGRNASQPIYVLHGDEDFLKRQVLAALRERIFGSEGDDFGFSSHSGDTAIYAEIIDELDTLPFLCKRRVVVVEQADTFVTGHRQSLEKYFAKPSSKGVLVLDVKTWAATTKLAKLIDGNGTIVCKAPAAYKLPEWCTRWAKSRYQKELMATEARLLVDLVGADMGQLDQELAKLSIYAGNSKRIEANDVDVLVGRSSTANIFKIFDALGAGRPREALDILERLFDQGEDAIRMLGAFSMQMRRLAQLARLLPQGHSFGESAALVGLPPFAYQAAEQQLRHLGRNRLDRFYDWLIEMDLGMKGSSPLPPRLLLERLVARLARRA